MVELLVNGVAINEIETTVCQVQGVQASRIVADQQGILEVFALADSFVNLDKLPFEIEKAIFTNHEINVDPSMISIAKVSNHQEVSQSTCRPQLKTINIDVEELKAKVSVVLEFDGSQFESFSSGVASSNYKFRLIGEATLGCIEKMQKISGGLTLENHCLVKLGDLNIVVVSINILTADKESIYSGSSVIIENENEAMVKAVLSALNRKFGFV